MIFYHIFIVLYKLHLPILYYYLLTMKVKKKIFIKICSQQYLLLIFN